jgi:hypothetical protein
MGLLRKLKALLGIGALWGTTWAAIGAGVGWVIGVLSPEVWLYANPIAEWALGIGLYGFVSGIGFGGLLSLREARKRVGEISLGRAARWGVLGAAAVPPLFGLLGTFPAGTTLLDVLGAIGVTGVLGGLFASSSIAIARRAELAAGEEMDLIGS